MLTRRQFNRRLLGGLATSAVAPHFLLGQETEEAPIACRAQLVNSDRLRETLEKLSEFGRLEEGGTTRLGFSNEDLAARNWAMGLLRDEGLEVTIDAAANIRARRAGERDDLPTIAFGSHTDTVPQGGNFDGCVGSMGAIEVIRTLNEQNVRTQRPLEVILFSNEEGVHYGRGLFGSRALAGLVPADELELVDEHGVKLADWIRRYGGDPTLIETMEPPAGAFYCYLELHIEQGGVLWSRKIPLGIVEGIVGINEYKGVVEGFANHAGTTPMDQRRDALLTAAKIVQAVREIVTSVPGRQVGTVGIIRAYPGAPNVIPGQAEFTVELRDLSLEKIEGLGERIRERGSQLAAADGCSFSLEKVVTYEPALSDRRIRFEIQKAAEEMRAPALTMASGAGHDAQNLARLCPMGMIFVPSVEGISHSPRERSGWEEIACGAECLYRTILRLDALQNLA